MKRTMNKKTFLITVLALSAISSLNMSTISISATPASPYIAVVPSSKTIMIGWNHTVSIYTDYTGTDVWGWQVELAFDPTVLQCVKVTNGDIITTDIDPSARFTSSFNNSLGEVSAAAWFFYSGDIPPPVTTSGPGTLVVITFTSVGYSQTSSLTLDRDTKLQVFDPLIDPKLPISRIEAGLHPNQIGHGTVMVTVIGDITSPGGPGVSDGKVDVYDLRYVGSVFGTSNAVADFTGPAGVPDGVVNKYELSAISANFGKHI